MKENEFLLQDRLAKIRSAHEQLDLCKNAAIAFSGGKDSTALSALVDEALPRNNIPRVFTNTGVEHKLIRDFVRERRSMDNVTKHTADAKSIRLPV